MTSLTISKKLSVVAASVAAVALATGGTAQAAMLSNGALSVNIRDDNGAIDTLTFGGSDFYNPGSPISNYGFQTGTNTSTFRINTTDGFTQQPVTVLGGPDFISVTGIYAAAANIAFTRNYSLIPGQNVLRIASTFTNLGTSDSVLSYFDTFDPDQGINAGTGFDTFNDVFGLPTGAGTATVGQASALGTSSGMPALTVLMGSLNPDVTVASGGPFAIFGGSDLNDFFSSPVDGNGTISDSGTHVGIRKLLAGGGMLNFVYDQAYGESPDAAQAAFIAANLAPDDGAESVPEPGSILGILTFGAIGASRLLKRKGQDALASA